MPLVAAATLPPAQPRTRQGLQARGPLAAHSPPSRRLGSQAEATVCGLRLGVELLDESEETAHTSSKLKDSRLSSAKGLALLLALRYIAFSLHHPTSAKCRSCCQGFSEEHLGSIQ